MGLALEESIQEEQDQQEEVDGISFIYEKKIASHVNDKIIDYITGSQSGFYIKKEGFDSCGGSCSSC